jgi:hypothetical protein
LIPQPSSGRLRSPHWQTQIVSAAAVRACATPRASGMQVQAGSLCRAVLRISTGPQPAPVRCRPLQPDAMPVQLPHLRPLVTAARATHCGLASGPTKLAELVAHTSGLSRCAIAVSHSTACERPAHFLCHAEAQRAQPARRHGSVRQRAPPHVRRRWRDEAAAAAAEVRRTRAALSDIGANVSKLRAAVLVDSERCVELERMRVSRRHA